MDEPNRYDATVEDGILVLVRGDDRLEIGPVDAIVDLIGGETYTLEYADHQAEAAWLATDEDGTVTFDVREELASWEYTAEFVENVGACPADEPGESGYSRRLEVFVDLVTAIWDAKGDMDP